MKQVTSCSNTAVKFIDHFHFFPEQNPKTLIIKLSYVRLLPHRRDIYSGYFGYLQR
jgi:hypothetical protein